MSGCQNDICTFFCTCNLLSFNRGEDKETNLHIFYQQQKTEWKQLEKLLVQLLPNKLRIVRIISLSNNLSALKTAFD